MIPLFCSQESQRVKEDLVGTAASDVHVWLLLEYDGAWPTKPFPGIELPEEVTSHLKSVLKRVSVARLQLIRRAGKQTKEDLHFYLAFSATQTPHLLKFRLREYRDLLRFDFSKLESILAHSSPMPDAFGVQSTVSNERLDLVCVHGRRDPCCAKWGLEVYQAMAKERPTQVWQTTHVGGHRFAANVVTLPHGYCYGRVSKESALPLLHAHDREELGDLHLLRGRCSYSAEVQAAEYFLRTQQQIHGLSSLEFVSSESMGDYHWNISFRHKEVLRTIELISEPTGEVCIHSCEDEQSKPVYRFRALPSETPSAS